MAAASRCKALALKLQCAVLALSMLHMYASRPRHYHCNSAILQLSSALSFAETSQIGPVYCIASDMMVLVCSCIE